MESSHTRSLVVRTHAPHGGFTLVEMLISLSIIFIISAIAITSQSTFNQTILLNDTSYTVALSARQAQSLGLASRKFSGIQNAGYGIHFSSVTPASYLLFADISSAASKPPGCPITSVTTPEARTGNCLFDTGGTETYQTYSLSRGFTISNICGKSSTGMKCSGSGDFQSLDIVFIRPNTVSVISGIPTSGSPIDFSCAQITVKSPTSSTVQTVRISQLGEVSVGQVCS